MLNYGDFYHGFTRIGTELTEFGGFYGKLGGFIGASICFLDFQGFSEFFQNFQLDK